MDSNEMGGSESKIVSLTGPSGAGKTTIVQSLLKTLAGARIVTSYTTRARRNSDLPGEYEYYTLTAFNNLMRERAFLWHVSYANYWYGTTAKSIDDILAKKGTVGMLCLVPSAIETLRLYLVQKHQLSAHTLLFIAPPSETILRERLKLRGDTGEAIDRRLREAAAWEQNARASGIPYHFVGNEGTIDEAVQAIVGILKQAG